MLGAKPELRGNLRFRQAEDLDLRFVDGRGGARPFLLFPDSRRPEKRWDGFKKLTEMLLREDRARKVVWAGNNYLADRRAFPPGQFLNLTGNTSLVSLPALIKRAEWVITNDSGPMHLAAALGVKVLGIFGPTDPRQFGPYPADRADQLRHPGAGRRPAAPHRKGRLRPVPADPRPLRAGSLSAARFYPCSIPRSYAKRPELVRAAIAKKHLDVDLDAVLAVDAAVALAAPGGRAAALAAEGGERGACGDAEGNRPNSRPGWAR